MSRTTVDQAVSDLQLSLESIFTIDKTVTKADLDKMREAFKASKANIALVPGDFPAPAASAREPQPLPKGNEKQHQQSRGR
jgi:hypothetical protein